MCWQAKRAQGGWNENLLCTIRLVLVAGYGVSQSRSFADSLKTFLHYQEEKIEYSFLLRLKRLHVELVS